MKVVFTGVFPEKTPPTSGSETESLADHSVAAQEVDARLHAHVPLRVTRPAQRNSVALRAKIIGPHPAVAQNRNTGRVLDTMRVYLPDHAPDGDDGPRDQAEAAQTGSNADERDTPSGERRHAPKRPAGDTPGAKTPSPRPSSAETPPPTLEIPHHSS